MQLELGGPFQPDIGDNQSSQTEASELSVELMLTSV